MAQASVDVLEARIAALETRLAPREPRRSRRRLVGLAILALTVAIAAPSVVLANHLFSDVATSSSFHTTISNIKQAGLTSGCAPNKYCPADPVRRDAMSSFLNRGLGRGSTQGFGEDAVGAGPTNMASVTIATPGAGWIMVEANATAINSAPTGCPCEIIADLKGPGNSNGIAMAQRLENSPTIDVRTNAHLGVHHLFAIPAAGNHTFVLQMQRFTGTASVLGVGEITAIWIPFGEHGEAYFGDSPQ